MFEVLYNLSNEKFCVVEIRRLDLADESDKSKVYSWFHVDIEKKNIEKLSFKSSREEDVQGKMMNIRIFENAELRFDKMFSRFISNAHEHILMNCAGSALPKEVKELIENYLK